MVYYLILHNTNLMYQHDHIPSLKTWLSLL